MTMLWPRPGRINGLYKAEVIHRRGPWRSFEAVELATLEWVDWFNNRRLLEPIGNIPPAEAEERHYAMLNALAETISSQTWRRDSNKMASAKPGAVQSRQVHRVYYRSHNGSAFFLDGGAGPFVVTAQHVIAG